MEVRHLHPWNISTAEARQLQLTLAPLVSRENRVGVVRFVAGADLSPPDASGLVRGAVVVLSYPELAVVESRIAVGRPHFPYIPGLLSFREAPLLLAAFEALSHQPDLVFIDGQGLAHPRRMGLACHMGLSLEVPTIGCAKSRLCGTHDPVGDAPGSQAALIDEGDVIGAVVRTRAGSKPLYISIGHLIDLPGAVQWTLACTRGLRIPEPTRLAHLLAAGKEIDARHKERVILT